MKAFINRFLFAIVCSIVGAIGGTVFGMWLNSKVF